MNGKTNAKNGAGSIRSGCAVLEIRAPAGSQITATRSDGLTKKQNKGYIDFSNTDFQYFYIIIQSFELSNLTWTITATNGSDTASTTVLITTNKEYEVSISYRLYIIKAGEIVLQPTITGGTLVSGDAYAVFSSDGNHARLAYISVAVGDYDALCIDIASGSGSYSYSTTPGIGLSQTQPTISDSTVAVSPADAYCHMVPDSASFQTVPAGKYTADISQFGGSAFVWIALSGMRIGDGVLNIENFYLE